MEIALSIIVDIFLVLLLALSIGTLWLLFRNVYCFQKTQVISKWILYYRLITDEDDIDYNIDDYDEHTWELILNPFRWTLRSMCNDKEKFDKLKKFIVEHPNEIAEMRKYIKENLDTDV